MNIAYSLMVVAIVAIVSATGANTVRMVENAKLDYARELQCRAKNGSYLIYKGEPKCVKDFIPLDRVEAQ